MKALLVTLIACLGISCSSPFYMNIKGYEVLHEDLDTAWKKVSACTWEKENGGYVKSPLEFFKTKKGDCTDFTIALMYLLGSESKFICINTPEGKHNIVLYDNKYIEPQKYGKYYDEKKLNINGILDYNTAMEWATNKGTKSL